jgi:hypothetical protein
MAYLITWVLLLSGFSMAVNHWTSAGDALILKNQTHLPRWLLGGAVGCGHARSRLPRVSPASPAILSPADAEAESVLRRLLLRQDVEQRWRVHLALGRLLVQRGDKQRNENLFAEAYAEAQKAIDLAPDNAAEPHFFSLENLITR